MTKTIKIVLVCMAICLLLIAGCSQTPTGQVIEQKKVKVGFIGPLSGDIAFLGEASLKGIQLAVDEINIQGGIQRKQIELIVEDDQLTDQLTQTAYHKLVDVDSVDAILSVSYGGILSLAEQAEKDQMIIIDTIDTSEELADAGDFIFAIGIYDEGIGYTIADFAKQELGKEKVGIIFFQAEPFVVLVKDSLKKRFEEVGGKIVLEEGYAPDTADFRTPLMKAKQAGIDTIVVLGYDEAGFALKQAKELGMDINIIGMDTFSSEIFLDIAGEGAEEAYFTFWQAPDQKEYQSFEAKFKARFGEEPSQPLFTATSYDSMKVLAKAMEKSQRGEGLKQALHDTKDHDGISGSLTMGEDGVVKSIQEEIFQIQGGSFVKVE